MTPPLHEWSAVRLAQALAARELSARALADALIERSRALDPQLQAWAGFDPAAAQAAAQALDDGPVRGPLHGLPLAVKDNIDTAGRPTGYGSPIYAGHVPAADAACVAAARAAGAYVMGKTASTELANMTAGPTRHPQRPGHTPGGSSSGSAAAVAAGLVPLALGTQTAGSVIRPAAFCGVVGYKPSPRRIPRAGVKANSDTLDEVGIFARSVDDAALLAQAVCIGPAGGMSPPGRPKGESLRPGAEGAPVSAALPSARAEVPRIGVTLTPRAAALAPEMAALVRDCARHLAGWSAPVQEALLPPSFDALFDAHAVVQAFETARALGPEWLYRRAQLSPALAALIERGLQVDGAAYAAALAAGRAAAADLQGLFERVDVLITPAAPGEAPQGLSFTGDPLFNRPWQLLGCPCLTLPAGRGAAGLPLGLQVVARPQDDERLFTAAAWIEGRLDVQSSLSRISGRGLG